MRTCFLPGEPEAVDWAAADRLCENRFLFDTKWEMERTHEAVWFPDRIVWDQTPNGDMEWVFAFNRLTFLVTLGQAWRASGREKYALAAIRLLKAWLNDAPLTEQSKQTTWRAIETGIRCANLLRMADLLRNCAAFDPPLQSRLEESFRQHALWLMEAHGPFQRLSNWGVIQNHGLFLTGLALGETDWAKVAAERLDEALSMQVFPDGSHWEQSPMYHCQVLHCCLDTVQAARVADFALPERFLSKTKEMARALQSWCRPDGFLLCQSDTDEIDAGDMMDQAARLFADESLGSSASGKSTALSDSGNYMLRDGQGRNAGFLHFHCGCLGSGHGHADLLHVDLVANGESILTDSGRYTYVESPLRKQLKSPAAHNTIMVDGQDFTVYTNTWQYDVIAEPVKGEHRFTPPVDYLCGAHLGYLNRGVFLRRRVLRLGRGLWMLMDEACAADETEHCYERHFHFGVEGKAEWRDGQAVFRGLRASARMAFPDAGVSAQMSRQPLSRQYNLLEQADCLTLSASRAGSASLATVIATGEAGSVPTLFAERLPVMLSKAGITVPMSRASALRIVTGGAEWTVIFCHAEVISQVDLVAANGKSGYGKVLVFGPECEAGIAMAF